MNKTQQPLVFVLVLNYKSLDDTLECIETVRRNSYSKTRLLVIDNASPDGSGNSLAKQLSNGEFLQLPRNTGYAGGNNIGMSMALNEGAAYVLILNPDVRLPVNAIAEYVHAMENNQNVGILSPIQLQDWQGSVDSKFELGILQRHGYTWSLLNKQADQLLPVQVVFGAAMMIRSNLLEAVGGFDPLFFAYGEEEDFCRRALLHGWKIALTTRAPVVHLRTREKEAIPDSVLFLRTKGAYLLAIKDHQRHFIRSIMLIFPKIVWDAILLPSRKYPFSHYKVGRRHVLTALLWLVSHAHRIYTHRKIEITGRAYLDSGKQI